MNVPEELKYTSDHEWIKVEDGGIRVGITDYAQDALGDVVYVELPSTGTAVESGDAMGEVESTKSVSDIYAPVSGTVIEVNELLDANPGLLNEDPYGQGWLMLLESGAEVDSTNFLDASGYNALTGD